MDLNVCSLLSLFFLLITLQKETYGNASNKENEELVNSLAAAIDDILPPPEAPTCRSKAKEWNKESKEKTAKNVFNTLSKLLNRTSELAFEKLLIGTKCNVSEDFAATAILHMEIRNTSSCKNSYFFIPKSCKSVYCSWIGIVEDEKHAEMLGALCYASNKLSAKNEKELKRMDVCSEWRYGNSKFHRLMMPRHLTPWNKQLLMYHPPATGPTSHQSAAETGEKPSKKYRNPGGRVGLAGHGLLKGLGENRMDIPILLRMYKGTKQILVTAQHEKGGLSGPLATFYQKPEKNKKLSSRREMTAEEYFHSLIEERHSGRCSMKKLLKDMTTKRKISNSYLLHPYETDNAWVKAKIYMLIVTEKSCLYNLDLNSTANYLHFEWKTYDDSKLQKVRDVIKSLFNDEETKAIRTESRRAAVKYFSYLLAASAVVAVILGGLVAAGYLIPIAMPFAIGAAVFALAFLFRAVYKRRWVGFGGDVLFCEKR